MKKESGIHGRKKKQSQGCRKWKDCRKKDRGARKKKKNDIMGMKNEKKEELFIVEFLEKSSFQRFHAIYKEPGRLQCLKMTV